MNQLSRALLAAGGGESAAANYIEDVFSTYLYTGNGSTQTITNGIDLSGKGGMVWMKCRDRSDMTHALNDTNRGVRKYLATSSTAAEVTNGGGNVDLYAYNSNGFSLGPSNFVNVNDSGQTFASWTFRKQPKFFDVVTWTGNQVDGRVISHNLGASPGAIIVKAYSGTNATDNWWVWHRYFASAFPTQSGCVYLNDTSGYVTRNTLSPNNTAVTDTTFTITQQTNYTGTTYVAYLFAHDAGGFGASGTDNVISCGTFTTDGSGNATVSLGYEPQWVMIKRTDSTGNWFMLDTMRGLLASTETSAKMLRANTSDAEFTGSYALLNATGFSVAGGLNTSATYIYIAIRRGPMRTPTTGTSVFAPVTYTGNGATERTINMGFPTDLFMTSQRERDTNPYFYRLVDRLRGSARNLATVATFTEGDFGNITNGVTGFDNMTGVPLGNDDKFNNLNSLFIAYGFRRAPGFFDVVCYTGTGSATTFSHNLGVVPELMIVKGRSYAEDWAVYSASLANTQTLRLNSAGGFITNSLYWNSTTPTASVFTVGTRGEVNLNGVTYVAYLFATVAGVSKVGSYTGNGSSQTINCGFTTGARFVLIKRTDGGGVGDWYVWDSARGIVAGNDPHLSLNSTAAEVTSNDTIDPDNSGFVVNQVAATNINVNAATYIFLAIA